MNHLYSRFLFFGSINNKKSYFTCYEDVVNNGSDVLIDLYQKILGDTLSEDEVTKYINDARGASSHSKEKGRYHLEGGINNSALMRWTELDKDLVSVIEIINSDVMRRFGYKNISSHTFTNYIELMKKMGIRNLLVFFISKVFFILSKFISFSKKINIKRY
mgnify:FL=1